MQKAAPPYISWLQASMEKPNLVVLDKVNEQVISEEMSNIKTMVYENAVIIFGKPGCCMCHAMKRLLLMLGVNPAIYEVDERDETAVIDELVTIGDDIGKKDKPQFPAVFIGGKLFGGLDRLMAAHISGDLVPKLKKAGALWL